MKKLKYFLLSTFLISIIFSSAQVFSVNLAEAGESISKDSVVYDGSYRRIDYPNGDVPKYIGVCTDVIIRAYRKVGIDLQQEVHQDIVKNISQYSRVKSVDTNIDHRRVPNLSTFFKRHGNILPISDDPKDYNPGDIIYWKLAGGIDHIGLVVNKRSYDGQRHLVVHNIGSGQNLEDFLFGAEIVGHYSYPK